jgi:hypothetical protein
MSTCNFAMFLESPLKVVNYGPELLVTYGRNNHPTISGRVSRLLLDFPELQPVVPSEDRLDRLVWNRKTEQYRKAINTGKKKAQEGSRPANLEYYRGIKSFQEYPKDSFNWLIFSNLGDNLK